MAGQSQIFSNMRQIRHSSSGTPLKSVLDGFMKMFFKTKNPSHMVYMRTVVLENGRLDREFAWVLDKGCVEEDIHLTTRVALFQIISTFLQKALRLWTLFTVRDCFTCFLLLVGQIMGRPQTHMRLCYHGSNALCCESLSKVFNIYMCCSVLL